MPTIDVEQALANLYRKAHKVPPKPPRKQCKQRTDPRKAQRQARKIQRNS